MACDKPLRHTSEVESADSGLESANFSADSNADLTKVSVRVGSALESADSEL